MTTICKGQSEDVCMYPRHVLWDFCKHNDWLWIRKKQGWHRGLKKRKKERKNNVKKSENITGRETGNRKKRVGSK
jgi:hypothetical protein